MDISPSSHVFARGSIIEERVELTLASTPGRVATGVGVTLGVGIGVFVAVGVGESTGTKVDGKRSTKIVPEGQRTLTPLYFRAIREFGNRQEIDLISFNATVGVATSGVGVGVGVGVEAGITISLWARAVPD